MRTFVVVVMAAMMVGSAVAQEKAAPQAQAPQSSAEAAAPAAKAADVKDPEAIVAALYDVISGPGEKPRDWERFKSLFAEGARLIPLQKNAEGKWVPRVLSPEGYVERTTPLLAEAGFYEKEIARRTERYGDLVHVWSTYAGGPDPAKPNRRGINSIQLLCAERCWIMTVMWLVETPENPLPAEYLKK